jgi:UDP-glucose 4-epimerase
MEKDFSNFNVLITGGLGFIGSNLSFRLVESGARVTIIDNLFPDYGGNLFNISGIEDKVKVNISDVRDERSMRELLKGKDLLFNMAGQTSHIDSMQDPLTDLEMNCRAQLSTLEACRKYNSTVKIIFASTRQLYGKPEYLPVDETHLLRPVDVNGINKMAGEWYHILYNNVYGIKTCALRLTNTYGPRMRIKDARQTFLGVWIRSLLEEKPFEVWGGEQLRDFTYIDDAVDLLLAAALSEEVNGQVFNVGGERPYSLLAVAQMCVRIYGKGEFVIRPFSPEREKIDIGDYYADHSKLASLLEWNPKFSLEQGLKNTFEFYAKNLVRYV